MRWMLVVLAGCRIGFHDSASTVLDDAATDVAIDAENDAAHGTRIVTFGERTTSMVKNVTTDASVVQAVGFDALNYGASVDMSVYGNVERALLRFDLSSLSSEVVVEATLELNLEDSGDQVAGMFQLVRLDESWTEGTGEGDAVPGATWKTRDGTTAWSSPGGTGNLNLAAESVAAIDGPISLPLLVSGVQSWIDAPASNHGMLMTSADGGHWHPTSRENSQAAERPQLRLVLQDP